MRYIETPLPGYSSNDFAVGSGVKTAILEANHTLATSSPVFVPKETLMAQQDYPEFSDNIGLFISSRGIESVHDRLTSETYQFTDGENPKLVKSPNVLQIATGLVFEHFVHQWLEQLDTNGFFLSPASCNIIFKELGNEYAATFTPDGAHISYVDAKPEIDWIMECKTNPQKKKKKTRTSLKKIRSFVNRSSGKTFRLSTPAIIDGKSGMEIENLAVSKNPRISLVMPHNRNFGPITGIDVIKTPFDSFFISRITHSVLNDISQK